MLSYDWSEHTVQDKDEIHAWCITESGTSSLVRIRGVPYVSFVELKDGTRGQGKTPFNKPELLKIMPILQNYLLNLRTKVKITYQIKRMKYFYGYGGECWTVVFKTNTKAEDLNLRKILSKPIRLKHKNKEYFINSSTYDKSVHRIRKFLTLKNVEYIGLFWIPANYKADERISLCTDEYLIEQSRINVCDEYSPSQNGYSSDIFCNPGSVPSLDTGKSSGIYSSKDVSGFLRNINMKIMTYDIECTSKRIAFPNMKVIEDYIFMISVCFSRTNSQDKKNILLTTVKDLDNNIQDESKNIQDESKNVKNIQDESKNVKNIQDESENVKNIQDESKNVKNIQDESKNVKNIQDESKKNNLRSSWKYKEYDVWTYNSEKDMLIAFCKLIRDEDPDAVLGFNILGFDFPYITHRLSKFWNVKPNYTRLMDEYELKYMANTQDKIHSNRDNPQPSQTRIQTYLTSPDSVVPDTEGMKSKSFSTEIKFLPETEGMKSKFLPEIKSLPEMSMNSELFINNPREWTHAGKFTNFNVPTIPGRLVLDNLPFIRDSYSDMKKHTLDNCSAVLLGDVKMDNEHHETFRMVNFLIDVGKNLSIMMAEGLTVSQKVLDEIKIRMDKCLEFLRSTANYCIKDTELSERLFIRTGMLVSLLFQAKVYGSKIEHILTRGKTQRSNSLTYNKVTTEGFVINRQTFKKDDYSGGMVLDPVVGLHKFVMVNDFTSLYPNIIVKYNLSPDTYFGTDEDEIQQNIDKLIVISVKQPSEQLSNLDTKHAFVKPSIQEGITRKICVELLKSRQDVKDKMKLAKNPKDKEILNSLQNVIKITTNSIYGDFGAQFSNGYHLPIASCITTMARHQLESVKSIIFNKGCNIIYGDTDSIFYTKDGVQTEEECIKLAKEIEIEVLSSTSLQFPPEYPKFGTMLPITMKKYVIFPHSGGRIDKGTLEARGDSSKWTKGVFRLLIDFLYAGKSLSEILTFLVQSFMNIKSTDPENLVVSEGYGSDKGKVGMFIKRIQDGTKDIKVGDKISYLMLAGKGRKCDRMILDKEYAGEDLDYAHYIKSLHKASKPLIQAMFKQDIDKVKKYYTFSNKKITNISGFFIGRTGKYEFDPVLVMHNEFKKGLEDRNRYYLEIFTIRDILQSV